MRIPSLPCPAFTLLFDDQNLKTAELGTNFFKTGFAYRSSFNCNLVGSAVRNSGQVPGLRGQTASSLSEYCCFNFDKHVLKRSKKYG